MLLCHKNAVRSSPLHGHELASIRGTRLAQCAAVGEEDGTSRLTNETARRNQARTPSSQLGPDMNALCKL